MRVGLDFGGVIVRRRDGAAGEDTSLVGDERVEIAQPGVFEAVARLVSACDGAVWIVSKAGPRAEARTLAWLGAVDFFSRTGFGAEHVQFCARREDKKAICTALGLTHFVDDRIHVMQILRGSVPNLYLFGAPEDRRYCPPWATFVESWDQIANRLAPPSQGTTPHRAAGVPKDEPN